MKLKLVYVFLFVLFCISKIYAQNHHFINDEEYRNQTLKMFETQKKLASKRSAELFNVFNQNLTQEESEALIFLYAYMPLSDLADYNGGFFLQNIKLSFEAKNYFSWGKTIPELYFRHFVLPCRINNENMDTARLVFFNELKERIKHLNMKDAALEVNHWCHEKVAYQGCDSRTSGPLTTVRNALGRCGEESTFTVAAMRAVGIPARQCYTPRWAHCDDNHAWVEVWVDGKWHFLGACEPEPDLDLGWFAAPAKRAMMVNTTVFGNYKGVEEVLQADERFTKINLLENYAPVKNVFVKVLDKNNKVVKDAKVEFQLYNYAEFYPIGIKNTNNKGIASLKTGYGDLLVWASIDSKFGFQKITVENTDTVVIFLDKVSQNEFSVNFDIVPPIAREVEVNVSEKQRDYNNLRVKYEDSIRKNYENTFADSIFCLNLAKANHQDFNRIYNILKKSRGNWQQISSFINSTTNDYKKYCIDLLEAISEKDLHDVSTDVLFDHLYHSKLSDKYDNYMNINYIMNPRIGDEMIKSWKKYFTEYFENKNLKNASDIANWINQNIIIHSTANYYRLPITPKGIFDLGVSDKTSRDLLFVALCRSFGIPSRLESATKIPQFYDWNGWNNMIFDQITESKPISKASIILHKDKENSKMIPEYSIHYTIEKFNADKYYTLDYENDKTLQVFPCTLSVEAGDFLLFTGNRLQNGSVLAGLQFFTLKPGQTKNINISMRKSISTQKVIGKISLKEKLFSLNASKTQEIRAIINGKKAVIIWFEPGKEPSRHAVVDIGKLKADFEKWGGNFSLVLPDNMKDNFDKATLNELPTQTKLYVDKNEFLKQIESSTKIKLSEDYPIVTVINEKGEIIYLSKGYKIGTGEQLLKIL